MPFGAEDFFAVFARYNAAIWPAQVAAYLLGLVVVAVLFREGRASTFVIAWGLAAMWLFNGVGYHFAFFAEINPLARLFAAVFVVQAVLLAAAPFVFRNLVFAIRRDGRSFLGLVAIGFAMLAYPVWGSLAGHVYPAVPVFGVAPCPSTIFTIGVLFTGSWTAVRWLLPIPTLWAAVGGSAAVLLGVPQDYGLAAALALVIAVALSHRMGWRLGRHEAA